MPLNDHNQARRDELESHTTSADLDSAVTALTQGEVIALPTETLFGLAADPDSPLALERLIRMKARPMDKGFILLVKNRDQLDSLILPPSPMAEALMDRFWPGPLTLVLPARPEVSPLLTGHTGQIAVRISPAPIIKALLNLWHRPLISTSANRAGQPTPCHAEEIRRIWSDEKLLVLNGITHPNALPSTLIKPDGKQVLLLRAGAIPVDILRTITPVLHPSGIPA